MIQLDRNILILVVLYMIQWFYDTIWYFPSLIMFHLVTIPSMSMFPFRFRVDGWKKWAMILTAAVASGLCARGLRQLVIALGWPRSYFQGQLCHLFTMVIFCTILYRGRFLSKLLTIILALSLAGQIGFVWGSLMLMFWAPEFTPLMIMVRDVLGYGTFALYYYLLRRYSNITSFYLNWKDHILLISIAFALFFLSCYSRRFMDSNLLNLLFYSTCVFATVAITYLLFRFTREHQQAMDQKTLLQDMRMSENALTQMQETSAQMKELRHELGNHFTFLESLAEQGQLDQIREYLRSAEKTLDENARIVATANPVVNSMINQKLTYARSLGIDSQAKVVLPDGPLPLDDLTLCSLLGNLINNAIEACRDQMSPTILVEIHPLKSYLVFRVENSVTYDVLQKNPHLLSTKEDAENHGIGLRVTKRIIEENNGILHYEMSAPDRFAVQVMLQI